MSFPNNIIWSPEEYAETAVLAREVADEMLARLEWMSIQPKVILDVGCGVGEMSAKLQTRYPEAQVLAMDSSLPMVMQAKKNAALSVCGDTEQLPLRDQSVDLLCANLLLPWYTDLKTMLTEWRRVLRPDGLLIFTALGPDTLREWRDIFNPDNTPPLIDMHDVGDILLKTGFADPVLDVEHITMTYRDQSQMIRELQVTGMLSLDEGVAAGSVVLSLDEQVTTVPLSRDEQATTVPVVLSADEQAATMPMAEAEILEVTFEIVYAHTWVPEASDEFGASEDGIVRIPLSRLRGAIKGR